MKALLVLGLIFVLKAIPGYCMVKPSEGHKYDIELQKVLSMNDTEYVVFEGLKVKRYNRTFYIADGKFRMNGVFDDSWTVEAYCWRSKLGNNQWELTSFKTPQEPVSEFLKKIYIPYIQPDVTPYSNLPVFEDDDEKKSFPGGEYEIKEYVGDIQNFPPHLQDGTYRIEIFLAKDGVVESGFLIWWKVYPEIG